MRHLSITVFTGIFLTGVFLTGTFLAGCQSDAPQVPAGADTTGTIQTEQAAPEVMQSEPIGWTLSVTTRSDGASTTVLHIKASEVRAHSVNDAPTLFVRCRSGTTDLYIDWHDYIPGASHLVTIRLDKGPTRTQMWTLTRSNVATFYPQSPVGLLGELMRARRLYAEATPYNETPVTAVFDLEGLEREVQPVRAACGW